MKKIFVFFFFISGLGLLAQVPSEDKPRNILPDLKGSVNDLENLMAETQQRQLVIDIKEVSKAKVIVFTTPDAGFYETFTDYVQGVALKNHLEKPGSDYVLIAVSRNLMEIQILRSQTLEKTFSDDMIQAIIDNEIIPEFKEDRFFGGIEKAVMAIKKQL